MATVRYMQALAQALHDEMNDDPRVVVLGEDVRQSLRRVTAGLVDAFGTERVLDTPLSEQAFTGFATGASLAGWRPVVEYQIPTLPYVAYDQIVNQAVKLRLMSGGQVSVPVTYVLPGSGARRGLAGQHSDHPYAMFVQAGLKTVIPATPSDAYGLFRSAIRDDDPVAVIAPAAALGVRETDTEYRAELVPLGSGRIHRRGDDVTVVTVGHLVQDALAVTEQLAGDVSVEVFDPRTVLPFDWDLLLESVSRTGRLVVYDDTNRSCGLGGEIVSTVCEQVDLASRPVRISRADVPVPFTPALEEAVLPNRQLLIAAIHQCMRKGKR